MSTYQHAAHERSSWGRWVLLALGLSVLAFFGAFAWDLYSLRQAADDLTVEAAAARDAVRDRDAEALAVRVEGVREAALRFAGATDGPHWWIANRLPLIQDQTLPLSTAGSATLAVAQGALEPLASMGNLESLEVPEVVDGRIDPYALEEYREPLAQAAQVLIAQQERLAAVDLSGAVPMVEEPFRNLRAQLAEIGDLVVGGHVAAELLPGMLGAEGKRNYVVLVQNNAEPRTTGGIPGAFIALSVEDGRFEMGEYASAATLREGGRLDFELTEDELTIFGHQMVDYPQNANFTPDFPRTAAVIAAFWERAFTTSVDGVVSIDPVALGFMLEGAPPVSVEGLEVRGSQAADLLLRDSYMLFPDPKDQDIFFGIAAATFFSQIVAGGGNVVDGTERAIDENRFMVWSAFAEEQALLAPTKISGGFLSRPDAAGVFLSDGSGSKIGYYVDWTLDFQQMVCAGGAPVQQQVTVDLEHSFTGDVSELPWYVSGGGVYVPEGEFHGNVIVYVPENWGILSVTRDGSPAEMRPNLHEGKTRGAAWVELKPGQSTSLVFHIERRTADVATPNWHWTPRATGTNATFHFLPAAASC